MSKASTFRPLLISAAAVGGMNLIGFSIMASTHTHKVFDMFGTGAFVVSALTTTAAYVRHHRINFPGKVLPAKPLLLAACVGIWGCRLGGFLVHRIMHSPNDSRFDKFLPNEGELPIKLAGLWTIQALWGVVTLLPVTMCFRLPLKNAKIGAAAVAGIAVFTCGFLCEAIADEQKRQFKAIPENKELWCNQGLWNYSRHPNYFGEILVWWGLFAASSGTAPMWTAISPMFVSYLLIRVSGIPLIEKKYDEKYKTNELYQKYKRETSILIPMPKSKDEGKEL